MTITMSTVEVDGGRLDVESWGDPGDPTVLLLAGTSCTRDWWPPSFCHSLMARKALVIRFDQRDTGSSTRWPVGAPAYGLPDLVDDAIAVLDALGVTDAHLVGFSQGGWVAQNLGVHHPDRVASLTLIATRAIAHGPADPDLPEVTDGLLAAWDALTEPNWDDPAAIVDYLVEGERVLAGDRFDESAVRSVCAAAVARSREPREIRSIDNHTIMNTGPRWREALGRIVAPTTVLHGALDPLFPPPNGESLAQEITGAKFRLLPGVCHELPERAWLAVIDAIADHLVGRSAPA
jgi:pimeloyl-ACP methyl ester carboxylesterase